MYEIKVLTASCLKELNEDPSLSLLASLVFLGL